MYYANTYAASPRTPGQKLLIALSFAVAAFIFMINRQIAFTIILFAKLLHSMFMLQRDLI